MSLIYCEKEYCSYCVVGECTKDNVDIDREGNCTSFEDEEEHVRR